MTGSIETAPKQEVSPETGWPPREKGEILMDTIPKESSVGLIATTPTARDDTQLDQRLRIPTKPALAAQTPH